MDKLKRGWPWIVIAFLAAFAVYSWVYGNPLAPYFQRVFQSAAQTTNAPKSTHKAYLKKNDPALVPNMWPPKQFPDAPKEGRTGPAATAPSAPKFPIIDVHEHVETEEDFKLLLAAMDRYGIARSCLMAATKYTFTLDRRYGFEQFKENNEILLQLKKKYPDRVCAFVTIAPEDEGNLELIKDYVARGADGLKLYLGHGEGTGKGPFHVMALDDERMSPIYAYAESIQLPILMHINLIKYMDETVSVLEAHPHLRLCIPHFGLHKNNGSRLKRIGWMMDRYPNLYMDMSFGWYDFHRQGFEALAKWRTRSQQFLTRYSHRLMFATDMVLEKTKEANYVDDTMRSYMQLLETKTHRFFLRPQRPMHGLDLPNEILQKIYVDTPRAYLQANADGSLRDRSAVTPGDVEGLPPKAADLAPLKPGEGPPVDTTKRRKRK